jgi:hypothetical protein
MLFNVIPVGRLPRATTLVVVLVVALVNVKV